MTALPNSDDATADDKSSFDITQRLEMKFAEHNASDIIGVAIFYDIELICQYVVVMCDGHNTYPH